MIDKLKKQLSVMVITFLVLFLGAISVKAEEKCTYQQKAELNELARKVKTSYEISERKETVMVNDPDSNAKKEHVYIYPEFKISIYNITKDIYISQTNSLTNAVTYITNEMANNGVYTFVDSDFDHIVTYSYKVLSNLEGCQGDALWSYTIKKPKSNWFASLGLCQGLVDVPYCQPYITEEFTNVTESNIQTYINNYLTDQSNNPGDKEEEKGIVEYLKNNWVYITIGVVLVAGVTGGTIYFVKKRSAL